MYRFAYGAGMAHPVGGSHPALDAAGDERPASLVPTHPADIAEDAGRRAVEGVGIGATPVTPTEQDSHGRGRVPGCVVTLDWR